MTIVLTGAEGPSVAPQSKQPHPRGGREGPVPLEAHNLWGPRALAWSRLSPEEARAGPQRPSRGPWAPRPSAESWGGRSLFSGSGDAGTQAGTHVLLVPEATGTPVLSSMGHVAVRKQACSTKRQRHCQKPQMQCRAGRARGQGFGIWGC